MLRIPVRHRHIDLPNGDVGNGQMHSVHESKREAEGFEYLEAAMDKELPSVSREVRVKVVGAVYRSIKRRTKGSREYIQFIHEYAGIRMGPGARAIQANRFLSQVPWKKDGS